MTVFQPADVQELQELVARAAAETASLEIVAGGSKRRLGRPTQTEHTLDLARLNGIIDYDPPELVLTAQAATPMAAIATHLVASQQMFAFEPPDWRGLLGGGGEPTLGGVIACNMSGPRRVRAGAARDHFLGFAAVNGWGDAWKSGGRVVKNVTGYDLCKLQAGAYGTLSILTELSVRIMPRPETSCSLLLHGLADAEAVAAMAEALNTPHEVSAAAHLPALVSRRAGLEGAATLLRLEGPAPSVAFRSAALRVMFGQGSHVEEADSERLWAAIAGVSPLLPPAGRCVWRLCPTPSEAPELLRAIAAQCPGAEAFYDWGGGLVWLSLAEQPDAGAAVVRAALRRAGGHATLVVAPDPVRAAVPVFEPEAGPLAALSERVRAGFDPQRILNPGRLREGL